ncbi:MAG: class B sortase [Clostridia bacterium]
MDKNFKSAFQFVSLLFLVLAITFFALSFINNKDATNEETLNYSEFVQTTTEQELTESLPTQEFESVIDFESLQEINSDVIAWIEIPNTDISYPILCSQTNNEAYLRADMQGNYDISGEIFIENYNQIDFSDPVTMIYGHYMDSGEKFGNLQEFYSNYEFFYQNNLIYVYFPNETKQYQIFAAVEYDTRHILYYNNFLDEGVFDSFIDEIKSIRSLSSVIDDSVDITSGDKLIILSTCVNRGASRFLVLAKQINI